MKKIFAFIITLTMVLSFPVFACASSDSVQGGIYLVEDDDTLAHTGNLDGGQYNPEIPFGTNFICGDYSSTTYNPNLLSAFKVTFTFGNEKFYLDLFDADEACPKSIQLSKGGLSFTLENKVCPRIWILPTSDARVLGNNTLSLADDYEIYVSWTYDGKKYEAHTTVAPVKGQSFTSFCYQRMEGTYKGMPLSKGSFRWQVKKTTNTYPNSIDPALRKSYYTVSMLSNGIMTYVGCDEDPSSEIFKSESIYYQLSSGAKKKITCMSLTFPDNLDESKVYHLKFKNSDGLEVTRPVTISSFGLIDNLVVAPSTTSVKVSWDFEKTADSYWITSSCAGNFEINDSEYNFTGLKPGNLYSITIRARQQSKYSEGKNNGDALKVYLLTKPLKVSNVKAVSSSGALKTSWKATAGTGYQIQVATNKTFTKNAKTYTVNTKSKKIKSLTKGKTYYVRVRAINTYNDNKVYGAWSSVVKAKL